MTARLGAYEILCELKSGGMGAVLLGRRRGPGAFEQLVALKTILPAYAGAPAVRAMFLDEAAILARVGHPGIAAVHDFGEEGGALYLAMEYVAGVPFRALAELEAPPVIAARAITEACRGLHAAHEAVDPAGGLLGVVHRDISPDNLMLGFDGHVKVIDFGIALVRNRQAPVTELGTLKGKPPYMSPEQVKNEAIDRRSDVFSLAVVLHELLAGRPLFEGDSIYAVARAVEHQPIPPPSHRLGRPLPPGLDQVVLGALERDPARRTPTAAALAEQLEAVLRAAGGETLEAWTSRALAGPREAHLRWLAEVTGGRDAPRPAVGRATGAVTQLPSEYGAALAATALPPLSRASPAAPSPPPAGPSPAAPSPPPAAPSPAAPSPAGPSPAGPSPAGPSPAGTGLARSVPAGAVPAGSAPSGPSPAAPSLAGPSPAGPSPAGTGLARSVPAGAVPAGSAPSGPLPLLPAAAPAPAQPPAVTHEGRPARRPPVLEGRTAPPLAADERTAPLLAVGAGAGLGASSRRRRVAPILLTLLLLLGVAGGLLLLLRDRRDARGPAPADAALAIVTAAAAAPPPLAAAAPPAPLLDAAIPPAPPAPLLDAAIPPALAPADAAVSRPRSRADAGTGSGGAPLATARDAAVPLDAPEPSPPPSTGAGRISIVGRGEAFLNILVDGRPFQVTPQLGKPISAGKHAIVLLDPKTNQVVYETTVTVEPGQHVRVQPP